MYGMHDIYDDTNPLSCLIVQRARYVNGAGHVFHGECTAYVPARDLVSNTRGCDRKGVLLIKARHDSTIQRRFRCNRMNS